MATVSILLSTYNSERFLRPQVDSILQQEDVNLDILVRDDGSNDATRQILDDYQSRGLLRWYTGENLGPARAFMQLLKDSSDMADAYAFSDHDDVWLKEKMRVATEFVCQYQTEPALYFCQTKLVDEHLKPFEKQMLIRPYCTLGEALVNHFIGGCTMVMNKPLRDIVNRYSPEYLDMHDIWIYLIAQSVGAKVMFDSTPRILYRQHGANQIGQGYSVWNGFKRHFRRLVTDKEHVRSRMAKEVLNGYGEMIPADRKQLIESVAFYDKNLCSRLSALFNGHLSCSNRRTFYLSKLAILFGTF